MRIGHGRNLAPPAGILSIRLLKTIAGVACRWRNGTFMRSPFSRTLLVVVLALAAGAAACGKSSADYVKAGDAALAGGDRAQAALAYRNALKKDALNGSLHFKLADLYAAVGNQAAALSEYVRAADLLPSDGKAQLAAAKALLMAGQYEDARTRAEKLLQKEPDNVEGHLLRGKATAGLKDLDGALVDLQQANQLAPQSGEALHAVASLRLVQGKKAEAEAAFKQAVAVSPKSVPARIALAQYYWLTGDAAQAEEWIRKAVALEPKSVLANRALVRLLASTNRYGDAEVPMRTLAETSDDPNDELVLVDFLVSKKRYDDARPLLEKLSQTPDGFVAASTRLAGIEYEQGHRDRAFKLIEETITKQPGNDQVRVLKGKWLLAEGKIEQASEVADGAVRVAPRSPDVHDLLGAVHRARSDWNDALKEYTEVVSLQPRSVGARVQSAQLQLMLGRPQQAFQLSNEALKIQPTSGDARFTLARALLDLRQPDKALAELTPLAAVAPGSAEVQVLLGQIQLARKETAAAQKSFERALEIDPTQVAALDGVVRTDVGASRVKDAQARMDQAIAKRPNDAKLLLLAGRTYATSGNVARAEALFRRAIEADPTMMAAYNALGQLFIQQSKLDEALRDYRELVARKPKLVAGHTMVAMILHVQNRLDEARKEYETALDIDPRAAVAANNVAFIDAEANRNLDVALTRAQTAKSILPDDPDVNDTLGWIYYKQGQANLAIFPLEQSVAKDATNAEYRYHLGLAYLKAGDFKKAKSTLEEALKQGGTGFAAAAEVRKALASIQGRL
jgi:putative PEP-CTERM system TPR-repeat lipoprotein